MEDLEAHVVTKIRPGDCLRQAAELVGDQYWLFVAICGVGVVLGSLAPLNILMGPMMCGIFLCFFARMAGTEVRFEALFQGFEHFIESLIVALIIAAVSVAIILPTYFLTFFTVIALGASQHDGGAAALLFFGVIAFVALLVITLSLVLWTLSVFAFPLIVDRGLKAIPALKASIRGATANFGGMLALMLVNALISFAAAIFCLLPVFLVYPLCLGATAIAYRQVFPRPAAAPSPSSP